MGQMPLNEIAHSWNEEPLHYHLPTCVQALLDSFHQSLYYLQRGLWVKDHVQMEENLVGCIIKVQGFALNGSLK